MERRGAQRTHAPPPADQQALRRMLGGLRDIGAGGKPIAGARDVAIECSAARGDPTIKTPSLVIQLPKNDVAADDAVCLRERCRPGSIESRRIVAGPGGGSEFGADNKRRIAHLDGPPPEEDRRGGPGARHRGQGR
ncbi:MAG: hypothetical protein ACRDVW_07800 [Acidimicrobiales bacterium]